MQEVDGAHIVVIRVPRAERSYKPVYVDGNPLCTYRRNGEGQTTAAPERNIRPWCGTLPCGRRICWC